MKKLFTFNKFESNQTKNMNVCSVEDLTNYYKCNNCGEVYNIFNKNQEICKFCNSNDLEKISDFYYMTELKKKMNSSDFNKELSKKYKRENDFIDLISMGISSEINKKRRNIN